MAEQSRSQSSKTDKLATFNRQRSHLFDLAYRMVGTVMDAEDLLQEAYLRWQTVDHEQVESPRAYLITLVSRLCIDFLRSAGVRRETYVGPWLPEPLLMHLPVGATATTSSPADQPTLLAESLSTAFLVILERLNPVERAIFLLREVFDYEYEEIAAIVGKSVANCRQIARRAREHVAAERPRFEPSVAKHQQLLKDFLTASRSGELDDLVGLLAEDVVLYADGGGNVQAARNPIRGATNVSRFVQAIAKRIGPDARTYPTTANQQPALVSVLDGRVIGVAVLQIQGGTIQAIYFMVNPEKLQHVPPMEIERAHSGSDHNTDQIQN